MIACGLQLTLEPVHSLPFRSIAIEGPIGVGKTALAERLATRLDAATVLEDTENPFLADFYAGRAGAALQSQLFYLLNRHRQQLSLRQSNLFAQTTICDYLFDKDKIFAYLNLDDNELFIYQRLYDLLAADVPSPDLVVYLQAPTEVLERRLRRDRTRIRTTSRACPIRHPTTSRSSTRPTSTSSSTTPPRRCSSWRPPTSISPAITRSTNSSARWPPWRGARDITCRDLRQVGR